jgi:hypothetical protein
LAERGAAADAEERQPEQRLDAGAQGVQAASRQVTRVSSLQLINPNDFDSATFVRKALQESDSENRNVKAAVLRLEEKCAGLELQVASLEQQLQDEKLLHLSANKKVKGLEEHTQV